MLYFNLQDSSSIAFYTPTKLPFNVGDEVSIDLTQDYSLKTYSITSSVDATRTNYIKFVIPSSSLLTAGVVGGLYTIKLIDAITWDMAEDNWNEADFAWDEGGIVYDTERGWVYEFISGSAYTSSFESSSYTTASLSFTQYAYTSSFESASYNSASLSGDGGTPYISVRETATYYVYNG